MRKFGPAGVLALLLAGAALAAPAGQTPVHWPAVRSAVPRDPKIEARIDRILKRMSVEEKVDQVVRGDRWGRIDEGFSEDPSIVRSYAGKMVEGLQGRAGTRAFLGAGHVISSAKHFVGDGGTAGGKDQGDNPAGPREIRDVHGAGYPPAIAAGVQNVMSSFSSIRGVKMAGNTALLTGALKGEMHFDGFIRDDWKP